MESLRFAIGDEDEYSRAGIRNILLSSGHMVVCEETDGPSLIRKIRSLSPDFVIVSLYISGMKGIEIARIVEGDRIAPVLITVETTQDVFIREMGNENFAYIIKPIIPNQLLGTIDFVYANFKKVKELEDEVSKLKEMLENRKIVEIAKGILMDNFNLKEKDAFRYLQKKSMDECKPVVEIAKRIIRKYQKSSKGS